MSKDRLLSKVNLQEHSLHQEKQRAVMFMACMVYRIKKLMI